MTLHDFFNGLTCTDELLKDSNVKSWFQVDFKESPTKVEYFYVVWTINSWLVSALSSFSPTQPFVLVWRGFHLIEYDQIFHPIENAGQFCWKKNLHCLDWPLKLNNQNDYSKRRSGTNIKEGHVIRGWHSYSIIYTLRARFTNSLSQCKLSLYH